MTAKRGCLTRAGVVLSKQGKAVIKKTQLVSLQAARSERNSESSKQRLAKCRVNMASTPKRFNTEGVKSVLCNGSSYVKKKLQLKLEKHDFQQLFPHYTCPYFALLWSSRAAGVHGTRCINSFEINLTTYEAE
jgi:hypothetical protein